MNRQKDICKVVTLGASGVGKTCLLQKIMYGTYNNENSMTKGIDCLHKTVDLGNKLIRLELWDTAGQERFDALNKFYIRNAMCILLVYDITNEESCFKLNKWCDLIDEQAPSDVIKILVGNKCDKRTRMITTEIGQSVADYLKMPFIEISSKEDVNVDELMDLMLVIKDYKMHSVFRKETLKSMNKAAGNGYANTVLIFNLFKFKFIFTRQLLLIVKYVLK
ncbi:uncharacterized protein LOC126847772 isoform X3 [Adelges cooleyi]|uniref:uncharacterized protein LOC126847772 isoform X3 n=1 Tax=Adelges cooleyi TaxID=133065 RepID=UPI00217F669B|nr:uncharacterized protein LOC126847772 isoform X3 [Adelges cooleyi]